jgi:hypothetical protein
MVGRGVQRVEAVELGLDLRAVGDGEADLAQDPAHLLAHEGERVVRARAEIRRRQRGVHGGPELRGQLRVRDAGQRGIEVVLQLGLGLVDQLADDGALVLGHAAHLFHQRGELAIRADVAGLGGLEVGTRRNRGQLGGRLGQEGGKLVLHGFGRHWVYRGLRG